MSGLSRDAMAGTDPSAELTFTDRLGHCYELAANYVVANPGSTLVHAMVREGHYGPWHRGGSGVEAKLARRDSDEIIREAEGEPTEDELRQFARDYCGVAGGARPGTCWTAAWNAQRLFGGEVVEGTLAGLPHAWLRLPDGRLFDPTAEQFGKDVMHLNHKLAGGESFLRQPHDTLYPCLFDERGDLLPGARDAIIGYFERNVVSQVPQARGRLRYAIIGSGASWNWDEAGDLDVQVWCDEPRLVSPLRSALAPHNLPDLGTILGTPACGMAVQFYVKAGRGDPIDNLATVPYAYYDLSDDRWYAFPQPLTPEWYAQRFVDVEDEAMALASRAQRVIAELERSLAAYAWWSQLASIHADPNFAAQLDRVRGEAGAAHAQVRTVFEQAKRARMDAYLPGGEGIADPRDSVFKLLEVWDVMDPLKRYAQSPLAELLGVT